MVISLVVSLGTVLLLASPESLGLVTLLEEGLEEEQEALRLVVVVEEEDAFPFPGEAFTTGWNKWRAFCFKEAAMDLLAGAGPSGRSQGRGHVVGATVTFANEALAFDLRSIMLGSLLVLETEAEAEEEMSRLDGDTVAPESSGKWND